MTDSLKVAQFIRGLQLNVFDHEQITITDAATGDTIVNLVARPEGYYMIFHAVGYTEQEAISVAILMLIQYYNHNIYQIVTED